MIVAAQVTGFFSGFQLMEEAKAQGLYLAYYGIADAIRQAAAYRLYMRDPNTCWQTKLALQQAIVIESELKW